MRTIRTTIGLGVLTLLLASCSDDKDRASDTPEPETSSPAAVDSEPAPLESIAGSFDVGGGRQLYLECYGSGSPTILFEAGGGDNSGTWPFQALLEPLQQQTRTCAYDRAGTGSSSPAPNRPRTMEDINADLDALLSAAGISDDLLLVGSSFGGQVVLDWALHHPERTAGLVILDTDWPTDDLSRNPFRELTESQRQEFAADDRWNSDSNVEHVAFTAVGRETESAVHPLPGIPITILTASLLPDCEFPREECARIIEASVELQEQWLQLSPTATRRIVESGHVMHQDVPDIVLDEVTAALDEAT
jgi:hypothetical protein